MTEDDVASSSADDSLGEHVLSANDGVAQQLEQASLLAESSCEEIVAEADNAILRLQVCCMAYLTGQSRYTICCSGLN